MKKVVILPLLAALLSFGAASSASAQQMKLGTVDMKKVFESYYKTKDAEARINEARNAAKKELEDRIDSAKKLNDEIGKLNEEMQKPELSKEGKELKSKGRDEKINELKTMQREIQEFQQTREKQLQEQSVRMRGGIVDEINKVIEAKVKSDQFDLVLDRSGPSLNGVPIVLFAKEGYDFTNDVVTALNKNRSSDSAAPATTSAPEGTKPAAPAAVKKK